MLVDRMGMSWNTLLPEMERIAGAMQQQLELSDARSYSSLARLELVHT